jgi:hypothetical protein
MCPSRIASRGRNIRIDSRAMCIYYEWNFDNLAALD